MVGVRLRGGGFKSNSSASICHSCTDAIHDPARSFLRLTCLFVLRADVAFAGSITCFCVCVINVVHYPPTPNPFLLSQSHHIEKHYAHSCASLVYFVSTCCHHTSLLHLNCCWVLSFTMSTHTLNEGMLQKKKKQALCMCVCLCLGSAFSQQSLTQMMCAWRHYVHISRHTGRKDIKQSAAF